METCLHVVHYDHGKHLKNLHYANLIFEDNCFCNVFWGKFVEKFERVLYFEHFKIFEANLPQQKKTTNFEYGLHHFLGVFVPRTSNHSVKFPGWRVFYILKKSLVCSEIWQTKIFLTPKNVN